MKTSAPSAISPNHRAGAIPSEVPQEMRPADSRLRTRARNSRCALLGVKKLRRRFAAPRIRAGPDRPPGSSAARPTARPRPAASRARGVGLGFVLARSGAGRNHRVFQVVPNGPKQHRGGGSGETGPRRVMDHQLTTTACSPGPEPPVPRPHGSPALPRGLALGEARPSRAEQQGWCVRAPSLGFLPERTGWA